MKIIPDKIYMMLPFTSWVGALNYLLLRWFFIRLSYESDTVGGLNGFPATAWSITFPVNPLLWNGNFFGKKTWVFWRKK